MRPGDGSVLAQGTARPSASERRGHAWWEMVLLCVVKFKRGSIPRLRPKLKIDHNVGVTDRETYVVRRVDGDYFGEEV